MSKKEINNKPLDGIDTASITTDEITSLTFFEDNIKQIRAHVEKNEKLYDDINSVFQTELKKFHSMDKVGGFQTSRVSIRDFAEVAKSLGSIRTTGLSGTQSEFNMKAKIGEMSLKKSAMSKNENESNRTELILRELTARLHTTAETGFGPNGKDGEMVNITDNSQSNSDTDDMSLLNENFNQAKESGQIHINKNEEAMKYDFQGVDYRYDVQLGKTVAINTTTNDIIEDYPEERIPQVNKVNKVIDGIAYAPNGDEIPNT